LVVYLSGISYILNKKKRIMKKFVFALFTATVLVACGNNDASTTEVKVDSTAVSVDTTVVAVDSTKVDSVAAEVK